MKTISFLAVMATALLAAACSSSSSSGTSGDGGGGGSSGGSSGGGGDSAGCTAYCTAIMANCTSTTPADGGNPVGNQQFTDMMNCLNSCKAFPVGTSTDMSGNTLGCRTNHANLAKSDPVLHCPHAGPGGDGTCGANCDGFCQLATLYCTAANMAAVYASSADCMTQCAMFPDSTKFNIGVQDGNSTACLLYHAQEASSDPPSHCLGDIIKDDAGDNSTTCH
jgi:hypothetical protein